MGSSKKGCAKRTETTIRIVDDFEGDIPGFHTAAQLELIVANAGTSWAQHRQALLEIRTREAAIDDKTATFHQMPCNSEVESRQRDRQRESVIGSMRELAILKTIADRLSNEIGPVDEKRRAELDREALVERMARPTLSGSAIDESHRDRNIDNSSPCVGKPGDPFGNTVRIAPSANPTAGSATDEFGELGRTIDAIVAREPATLVDLASIIRDAITALREVEGQCLGVLDLPVATAGADVRSAFRFAATASRRLLRRVSTILERPDWKSAFHLPLNVMLQVVSLHIMDDAERRPIAVIETLAAILDAIAPSAAEAPARGSTNQKPIRFINVFSGKFRPDGEPVPGFVPLQNHAFMSRQAGPDNRQVDEDKTTAGTKSPARLGPEEKKFLRLLREAKGGFVLLTGDTWIISRLRRRGHVIESAVVAHRRDESIPATKKLYRLEKDAETH